MSLPNLEFIAERLNQYICRAARRSPGIWSRIEDARRSRSWPGWCYVPTAEVARLLLESHSSYPDTGAYITSIAALAGWRMTRRVYRFDGTLLASLWNTPIERQVPGEVLFNLPDWCVYVATPGQSFAGNPLKGFLSHLDCAAMDGRAELRILLDTDHPRLLSCLPVDIQGGDLLDGLERARAELLAVLRPAHIADPDEVDELAQADMREYAGFLSSLVNLLLFLSSADARLADNGNGVRHVRYLSDPTVSGRERPHVRRAHWHSYWTGPEGQRRLRLRWIPPLVVGGS